MAGIDYGLGTKNIDKQTGIRFGVIPANSVGEAWFEASESDFGPPTCGHCGNPAVDIDDPMIPDIDETDGWERATCEDFACISCKRTFPSESAYPDEPRGVFYDQDGYDCWQDSYGDIFIVKSPFFTYAPFCSPCAPGACYLIDGGDESAGQRAYCFGHDWFEGDKAPHPVYSVETGEIVNPPAATSV